MQIWHADRPKRKTRSKRKWTTAIYACIPAVSRQTRFGSSSECMYPLFSRPVCLWRHGNGRWSITHECQPGLLGRSLTNDDISVWDDDKQWVCVPFQLGPALFGSLFVGGIPCIKKKIVMSCEALKKFSGLQRHYFNFFVSSTPLSSVCALRPSNYRCEKSKIPLTLNMSLIFLSILTTSNEKAQKLESCRSRRDI